MYLQVYIKCKAVLFLESLALSLKLERDLVISSISPLSRPCKAVTYAFISIVLNLNNKNMMIFVSSLLYKGSDLKFLILR